MFDQDLLRTFVRIVDSGSFAATAEQLGRTPSAVSMQMKRLEEAAGRRLLVRSAHGVAPTAEGETLLIHARQILEAHEAAFDAMMAARGGKSLIIGTPDMYVKALLQPHLAEFVRAFPETSLHVVVDGSSELLRRFDEGALHLALLTEYQINDDRGDLVYSERGLWACKRNTDIHKKTPLPLALAFEGSHYRRLAQDFLRRHKRIYRIAVASNRQHAIQAAIDAGAAVGLLPESWLLASMRELKQADGFFEAPPLTVRMRAKKRLSAAGEWFVDRLRASQAEHAR
ncbi:LysR family transcriptional regulator [Hyphococcus luteus]|nr:LysR family transcriptional regulator [Marinicaulis flavus]